MLDIDDKVLTNRFPLMVDMWRSYSVRFVLWTTLVEDCRGLIIEVN